MMEKYEPPSKLTSKEIADHLKAEEKRSKLLHSRLHVTGDAQQGKCPICNTELHHVITASGPKWACSCVWFRKP